MSYSIPVAGLINNNDGLNEDSICIATQRIIEKDELFDTYIWIDQ